MRPGVSASACDHARRAVPTPTPTLTLTLTLTLALALTLTLTLALTLTRRAVVPLTPLAHPEGSPRYRAMPHCGADLPDEIAVRLPARLHTLPTLPLTLTPHSNQVGLPTRLHH